ncbi:hypothetical protein HanPI659440_Chr12g0462601 [Helianthus annuus]|nr:hypothetical protein HanPI659440_Chr12g0462601 [Helianthus annuus]
MFWVDFNGVIDTGDGTVNTEFSGSYSASNYNSKNTSNNYGETALTNDSPLVNTNLFIGPINKKVQLSNPAAVTQTVGSSKCVQQSPAGGPPHQSPMEHEQAHTAPKSSRSNGENSSNAEENIFASPEPVVCRLNRNAVTSIRFNNYVLNSCTIDEDYLLLADDEPTYFNDAKNKPEWMKAMRAEIESINKNNTCRGGPTLVPPGSPDPNLLKK